MKLLTISAINTLLLFACACSSNKNPAEKPEEVINQAAHKMEEDGFKKGTIIYSEVEGDCPYTIAVENESLLFDPINLEESFKSPREKIWIKYRPLRIANRCDKASPVEIVEIAKRL